MKPSRSRASAHNERGRELAGRSMSAQAVAEYLRAVEADPDWSVPFYNLGLLHKHSADWPECLRMNQRAVALNGADKAGWWNLGIAATALGDWPEARRAWRACGIDILEGKGPVDYPCGINPVRLNPNGEAEVVWAERVDPARAELRSIPYPSSGFRFGDLVLNDGAPNGYRMLGQTEVALFDCLALLQPSNFSTFVAEVC